VGGGVNGKDDGEREECRQMGEGGGGWEVGGGILVLA